MRRATTSAASAPRSSSRTSPTSSRTARRRRSKRRWTHDESAVEQFDFTRGDYRILIALREDYLAHLEGAEGRDAVDLAEPDAARAHDRRAGAAPPC